jgi:hypothetical protein
MRIAVVVCCLLAVTGVACLIAGIVLFHTKSASCDKPTGGGTSSRVTCRFSEEAQRVGLPEFLQKVQDTFYDLHPERIALKTNVSVKEILEKFASYDPSPAKLQQTTDKSLELLREIKSKKIMKHKMKPREKKALAQVTHYLQHVFGTPYDGNYYAGDYLLGPSFFCLQAICDVTKHWGTALPYFKPSTVDEVQLLLNKIKTMNHTFVQYKENMIYGAKAGMVRSIEDCRSGVQSLVGRRFWYMTEPEGTV